jgi:hypothetical protein
MSAPKLDHHVLGEKDVYVKSVSASTPCTHAWTPEKNYLIIIILQCYIEHKNVFLHIPDPKITQIKIREILLTSEILQWNIQLNLKKT